MEGLLHGLVRVREHEAGIDIRVLGGGPALIRLGARRVTVAPERALAPGTLAGRAVLTLLGGRAVHDLDERLPP